MAIGDRIMPEKEYRIMSPPRRPRGEKPRTTIRWQRRQMELMEARIATLTRTLDSKTELAAELDRRISETPLQLSDFHKLGEELNEANDTIDRLTVEASHHRRDTRLAYLEGYFYAKSTETIRRPGEGDSRSHPYGAPTGQEGEPENTASRHAGKIGSEVWRFHPDDPAPHHRRPMDRNPIAGAPHDATASELERHRR